VISVFSTFLDRCSEDIRVLAIIIAELEFGDIEREIFLADLVKASHDAALDERPEAFDGLSMNCADDILTARMVNRGERIFTSEFAISRPLIGAEQANFVRDSFADKRMSMSRSGRWR
jgi:hypothetical protein